MPGAAVLLGPASPLLRYVRARRMLPVRHPVTLPTKCLFRYVRDHYAPRQLQAPSNYFPR